MCLLVRKVHQNVAKVRVNASKRGKVRVNGSKRRQKRARMTLAAISLEVGSIRVCECENLEYMHIYVFFFHLRRHNCTARNAIAWQIHVN
jgi:hypothetical protein